MDFLKDWIPEKIEKKHIALGVFVVVLFIALSFG